MSVTQTPTWLNTGLIRRSFAACSASSRVDSAPPSRPPGTALLHLLVSPRAGGHRAVPHPGGRLDAGRPRAPAVDDALSGADRRRGLGVRHSHRLRARARDVLA